MRAAAAALAVAVFALAQPALAQGTFVPPPPPCSAAPASDTLNGTAGAGGCYLDNTATRPSSTQRVITTTDANGAWSLTFARSFIAAPVVSAKPVMPQGRGDCGIATVTPTGASGGCWTYQQVTVAGASVSALSTAAAGVQVMIVAGAPTQ